MEAYGEYIANRVMEELHSIECKDVESYKNQCRKISIPTESIKLSSNFKDIMKYISDQFYKKLLLWLFSFVNSEILGFMNIEDNHHRSYCHVVQLGDLFLVLSPGEMFYEYGQRLMRHNGGKYYGSTLIFGLANDYSSYLYPVQEFAKGGYENVFQLAPKAGPYIVGALLRMLKNLTNSD